MAKFINPFTDIGFKKIFGQEITKDLLIDFLNDLLVGEREIKDIKFLDKEQLGTSMLDRSMIYDVYCETSTGEKIIVEMQNKAQANFKERSIYYLSNAIVRQGERGAKWEYGIKAVYGVFFMNFHLEENAQRVRRDVILADKETQEQFSDKMRFIYLEFPSFHKEENECENNFERWIYVLKNMETLKRMPFKAQKSVFDKLEQIADIASLSKADRMKYDESIKQYRDTLVVMNAQRKETLIEVARNLKSLDTKIDVISAATGLSEEEIGKL